MLLASSISTPPTLHSREVQITSPLQAGKLEGVGRPSRALHKPFALSAVKRSPRKPGVGTHGTESRVAGISKFSPLSEAEAERNAKETKRGGISPNLP